MDMQDSASDIYGTERFTCFFDNPNMIYCQVYLVFEYSACAMRAGLI